MRFVPDELEVVESHFFDSRIEILRDPFEMFASAYVVERIDETRVGGIERVDIVQHFVSAQVVRGEHSEKTFGQRRHAARCTRRTTPIQ